MPSRVTACDPALYHDTPALIDIGGLAAVADLVGFQADRLGTLQRLSRLGGNVRVRLPGLSFVFVFDHATCRTVLGRHFEKLDRGLGLKNLRDAVGDTMLTAAGEAWRQARRAHARTFRAFPEGSGRASALAWLARQDTSEALTVGAHDFGEEIASALLSQAVEGHVAGLKAAVQTAARGTSRRTSRIMTQPLFFAHRGLARIGQGLSGAARVLQCWSRADTAGPWNRLPPSERLGLLFAGGETISALLGWALLRLAHAPGWQDRIRQEGEVAATCFLLELLRLHPPVWMLTRRVEIPFEADGLVFRQGDQLLFPIWSYHRDPRGFARPECFDPDRFKDRHARHNPAFMPFGHGPHTCPGRHGIFDLFNAILQPVLTQFDVVPMPNTPDWRGAPELSLLPARKAAVTLAPKTRAEDSKPNFPASRQQGPDADTTCAEKQAQDL